MWTGVKLMFLAEKHLFSIKYNQILGVIVEINIAVDFPLRC